MQSRLICVCFALTAFSNSAQAQHDSLFADMMVPEVEAPPDLPPPTLVTPVAPGPVEMTPSSTEVLPDAPIATDRLRLRELRTRHLSHRRRLGFWLLGWGAVSLVGGTVAAIARRDETEWLSAGLTTAGFGMVNGLLSLGLLDLSGNRRRSILDDRLGMHTRLQDVREESRVAELKSGQTFVMNLGLDVFYIGGGLLMFALGRALGGEQGRDAALRGAGLAIASQGLWLFGFDLAAWRMVNAHAAELAR